MKTGGGEGGRFGGRWKTACLSFLDIHCIISINRPEVKFYDSIKRNRGEGI